MINMAFDYSVIGSRIRQAREEQGITQEQLAEQLDVSNAYISKIERGKTPINLDRLSQLCMLLEESTEYILNGADRSNDDYLRNEIMVMLENCSPAKIKLITQLIKSVIEYEEEQ
ncbi:XRE family transcriptional regulator [Paenibacillaceae bacterium]|nr:XRE family transcriptional regulator [Paenibacillaceae bacterium]